MGYAICHQAQSVLARLSSSHASRALVGHLGGMAQFML